MRNLSLQCRIAFVWFCISIFSTKTLFASKFNSDDSVFKTWYFTPTEIRGSIPLSKITDRYHIKILRVNESLIYVLSYNPAGIVYSETHIQFSNGKIALMATVNRWGEPVDSTWFSSFGPSEFFVTEKLKGQNPNAPCQGLRFIYKNDQLHDIYCMQDSNRTGYNQEGVAHYVFERYDDPKRFSLLKSETFYGDIDNPVISRKLDCHKILTLYDENGNLVSRSIYGLQDEPVADRNGSSQTKMRYNNNNEETEKDYFDTKGFPWNEILGCAIETYDYHKGFLERETFYNDGYKIIRSRRIADSAAIVKYSRSSDGETTEKAFFDEQGLAINNHQGIHRTVSTYNEEDMLTGISFFDNKGSPVTDESGIHRYHFERNLNGEINSKTEFNVIEIPVRDLIDGVYEIKYRYDGWGRVISGSYWLNDSIKMSNRFGHREILFKFDPSGMITRIDYIDAAGKTNSPLIGYNSELLSYNPQELVSERKYLKSGLPVMLSDTMHAVSFYSSIQYSYDLFNRVYSLEYFDDGGRAVNTRIKLQTNGDMRCHKVEFSYAGSQMIAETFYDKDNIPMGRSDCRQDNCVLSSGTGIQMKKMITIQIPKRKKPLLSHINLADSFFYADQLAFLGRDSVVLFLNAQASNLCEFSCATYYRITSVTRYYQQQGEVNDYYLENDTLGARLHYDGGMLNGPAVYYFKNGHIREQGEYHSNERAGTWEYFYDNGSKYKTIEFTDHGKLLMDYFTEDGRHLVSNGNGVFAGTVSLGRVGMAILYSVSGEIKNGLQNGLWKISLEQYSKLVYTEKFSLGKFDKGTAYGFSGESTYKESSISSFESNHPQEQIDHYGQNFYCSLLGKNVHTNAIGNYSLGKNFYSEIHQGVGKILNTHNFKDYSGWIFLYMHFDEHGLLSNKAVLIHGENEAFKKELLKFLDGLGKQTPLEINNANTEFSKFYIVLVENDQLVIPEELLADARSLKK